MIFPITHEDMTSRRWPFLTVALMVACLVSFVVFDAKNDAFTRDAMQSLSTAMRYYDAHPYLTPCPTEEGDTLPDFRDLRGLDALDGLGKLTGGDPALDALLAPERPEVSDDEKAREQATLDAHCQDLRATLDTAPARRFGFVPAHPLGLGLLTHAFLHGGWDHLLFNMWFLWLCGCNLEDRWGRAAFAAFYMVAAIAGAVGHMLAEPGSMVPLIGASGAIAGAMGAFLVAFSKTKIRFFYLLFRWGTFAAPAYVMLPLWLVSQVFWGLAGIGDGVAYFAHVGGFVFGVVAALGLRASGIEKRLDDAVEESITTSQDPRILRASALIDDKSFAEAIAILEAVGREQPSNVDVQLELVRAAKGAGDRVRETRAYARCIALYVHGGHVDAAIAMHDEAESVAAGEQIRREDRYRVAEELSARRLLLRAIPIYAAVRSGGPVDVLAVRAMVAEAKALAVMGHVVEARALLDEARGSPFSTLEIDGDIDAELARIAASKPA